MEFLEFSYLIKQPRRIPRTGPAGPLSRPSWLPSRILSPHDPTVTSKFHVHQLENRKKVHVSEAAVGQVRETSNFSYSLIFQHKKIRRSASLWTHRRLLSATGGFTRSITSRPGQVPSRFQKGQTHNPLDWMRHANARSDKTYVQENRQALVPDRARFGFPIGGLLGLCCYPAGGDLIWEESNSSWRRVDVSIPSAITRQPGEEGKGPATRIRFWLLGQE
ncbi:hypothetical protein VTI74DRAFT_4295 [Chaetomium olivicolor]